MRDGFKCQYPGCKRKKGYIQAHHIKRWADYPLLRYETKNGISLCRYHHNKINAKEEYYEKLFHTILLLKGLK